MTKWLTVTEIRGKGSNKNAKKGYNGVEFVKFLNIAHKTMKSQKRGFGFPMESHRHIIEKASAYHWKADAFSLQRRRALFAQLSLPQNFVS